MALVGAITLGIGSLWSATRPSVGMASAYERYPGLSTFRHDLGVALHEYVATILTGLARREPRSAFAAGRTDAEGPLPTLSGQPSSASE